MTVPGAGDIRAPYSVSALTAEIKRLLDGEYPDVRVSGEISNATRAASGHWYFTLKDSRAELSCVCFARYAHDLRTEPADGAAVVARGRVSVFAKRGRYQLQVQSLEPRGLGDLQLKFEQLKAKLAAEGLFDEDRKRLLPATPRRIGVVSSPTGAAIADILRVLERRFPGLHVRLYPVRVQGRGAAAEIAEGVAFFGSRSWADVVIVGRGGGSLEDLWAFNEEAVARAIAASQVPVVSAVGHETDFTIADFAADLRAATPSAAAARVVPEAQAVLEAFLKLENRAARALSLGVERMKTRLLQASTERAGRIVKRRVDEGGQALDAAVEGLKRSQRQRFEQARKRLSDAELALARLDLRVRFARLGQRLGAAGQRLAPAVRRDLDRRKAAHAALASALERLNPRAILERGYAIVTTDAGKAVTEHSQVRAGDPLDVLLHRGRLAVRTERAEPEPEREGGPPRGSV